MSERTGGHSLDTGEGPVPLEHLIGRGVESPAIAAWRAYVAHTKSDCKVCLTSVRSCPTANELWDAYGNTRHTG